VNSDRISVNKDSEISLQLRQKKATIKVARVLEKRTAIKAARVFRRKRDPQKRELVIPCEN